MQIILRFVLRFLGMVATTSVGALEPTTQPAKATCDLERIEERRFFDAKLTTRPWGTNSDLTVNILVTGPDAKGASAYRVKLDEASDSTGANLMPQVDASDSYTAINDVSRNGRINGSEGFEAEVTLKPTADRSISQLAHLHGTVFMRTGGKTQLVDVPTLSSLDGKDIALAPLKAAGLKIHIVSAKQNGTSIEMEATGTASNLVKTEIVDEHGNGLIGGSTGISHPGESDQSFDLKSPLPSTAHLRLTVVIGQVDVAAPFDFKDLKLP